MNATIRPLTPADADAYRALRLRGLREEPTAFAASAEEEGEYAASVFEERVQSSPLRLALGAFVDGRLVGTLALLREPKRKLAHKGLIVGVYVAPEARRHGLARRMMETALAHAFEAMGVQQVNLAVNAANPAAVALYERCGFERFGLERACMIVDGESVDEIHMVRFRP